MLGKPAPDFSLPCTGGSSAFRLSKQRAKTLWRYFYPEDHTPGGTTKRADFRDRHSEFKREIYGVSRDALNSRAAFKAKMKFPFDLLSDPAERACAQFGVMKDKNLYGKKVRG